MDQARQVGKELGIIYGVAQAIQSDCCCAPGLYSRPRGIASATHDPSHICNLAKDLLIHMESSDLQFDNRLLQGDSIVYVSMCKGVP